MVVVAVVVVKEMLAVVVVCGRAFRHVDVKDDRIISYHIQEDMSWFGIYIYICMYVCMYDGVDVTDNGPNHSNEGNVLFNDGLNTFYLPLYTIGHMVKNHSNNERVNPLPPLLELLFSINSKGSFTCTIPQTGYYIPRPLLHQL